MKLRQSPLIFKGFKIIYYDQPHPWSDGSPDYMAEIPDAWEQRFLLCESLLQRLNTKSLQDLGLSKDDLSDIVDWEYEGVSTALHTVIMPCNDDDVIVMKKAGFTESEIKLVQDLTYEWFEGSELDCLRMNKGV